MKLLPPRRWLTLAALLILFAALAGLLHTAWPLLVYPTATIDTVKQTPLPATPLSAPVAGIAEVDITPPIGMPKFGYSAWSRPADGFRTRLKARAFYLHSPGQTPLALVQLDLGSGSLPLHYRVAELVAEHTDVPAHGLSLLSTHTHSGPGQYLGSDFYNLFGSNQPGFDPALFEFLSERIALAVTQAYQQRREARIGWGQQSVWGVTRNRSLAAWLRNPGATAAPRQTEQQAYQAVNPTLTLLRIDQRDAQGDFHPAGALSLFSIHGTGIAPFTRPYHADVWHWFSQGVNNHWREHYPGFIHGAAQATHGDNTPAWIPGGRGDRETRRLGDALSQQALALFAQLEGQLDDQWQLAAASQELDLLADLDSSEAQLCQRAVVGTPVVGAAKGDEVFPLSFIPPFKAGSARQLSVAGCQGEKYWMLSALQRLLPAQTFPHRALVQVLRINDQVLLTLPWEVTYEAGNRLRQAVIAALPETQEWRVEVASLANGYLGYAVTPQEYQAQYYEGGHTLYGPNTLPYLQAQSQQLTRDLINNGSVDGIPATSRFTLRQRDYFVQQPLAQPVERQWQGPPHFVEGDWHLQSHWLVDFIGEPASALPLHEPLLTVYCDNPAGEYQETDNSGNLELRLLSDSHDRGHYQVRWYTAPLQHSGDCRLQLQATASGSALEMTLPGLQPPS